MSKSCAAVPAEAAQLPVLTRFLQEFWSAASLPPAHATTFELALEEIFVNVVMHGARGSTAPSVQVSLALAEGGVTMTVEDDGPCFDPLTLPAPDITASLEQRPIGGLGIHLVRRMMDAVSYRRVGTRNQLKMSKRVGP